MLYTNVQCVGVCVRVCVNQIESVFMYASVFIGSFADQILTRTRSRFSMIVFQI